ncbi:MAG TPA: SigE family RNA polymerase sigma factor [Propionicimonas sp.]|nr:SigE family RNA polymerase sigma factor [Propionicimonas sp.]
MQVDARDALRPEPVETFDDFVRARTDSLLRLACLVTRNWEDARDATQDALAKLYPRWSKLESVDYRDAYVHRAVVNASLTVLRRVGRERPVGELTGLPPAAWGDPARDVANADEAWRLLGELPPNQRAAVVLRFYRDLSFAEIADALGCREATARSHVHRAMATLRSRLEGGSDG